MAVVNISGTIEVLVASTAALTEIPPTITAAATASTTLRVTFSKIMQDDTDLSFPSNYVLVPITPGAAELLVNSVVPEGGGSPTFVDLTLTEMTDGATYELTVQPAVVDLVGLPVEFPTQFTGQGQKPSLVSATATTSTRIRVVFDEPMTVNAALTNPASYTVTPQAAGVGAVVVISAVVVTPGSTTVDLVVSEMNDGGSYELAVDSAGPVQDVAFNPLDPGADTDLFTGIGVKPTLLRIEAAGKTRVDVVFSESMRDNADIRDVNKFEWETVPDSPLDDITTLSILAVEEDVVKLVTSEQTPGILYELTVAGV
ncbi:hypothetical protein LCGC14_1019620 [marine sediment metagenome]|uniref:SbsA Ig-like domain-containing protein n=1 Tax=marine sediment metagenome TaxID=412755 RepID=A0A0F9R3R1_9ZZZZ